MYLRSVSPGSVIKLLRVLVKAILEDEDNTNYAIEDAIDRAKELLSALKDLKAGKKTMSFNSSSCPPEFRCPLSKRLMRDPVIISTGQVSFTARNSIFINFLAFVNIYISGFLLLCCYNSGFAVK